MRNRIARVEQSRIACDERSRIEEFHREVRKERKGIQDKIFNHGFHGFTRIIECKIESYPCPSVKSVVSIPAFLRALRELCGESPS